MKKLKFLAMLTACIIPFSQSWSANLTLQKVSNNIYAIVGELGNRSADNLGNNATFGFVITDEGIVLIDSGGSYLGAKKIHKLIKTVTDKSIVTVINTGGQDHRWLGNGYFKKLGAEIIASKKAVADQKVRSQDQFVALGNLVGDEGMKGTEPVYAGTTFKDKLNFKKGSTNFMVYHEGQAHTPGDAFVWLPKEKVMFSGDIVYINRMLGVGGQSNSKSWIDVYQKMVAHKPKHIIPGHGPATNLKKANKDTYNYLVFLRKSVAEFMESGGDITEIKSINFSKFNYLLNYESLSGRNAQQVYMEMEWE